MLVLPWPERVLQSLLDDVVQFEGERAARAGFTLFVPLVPSLKILDGG